MKKLLIASATALMLVSAPAHAGFWSGLSNAVSSMFSGAGITGGVNTTGGTIERPLVVTSFPPSRLTFIRSELARRQQVQSGQFDVGVWLLTGVKVPPARVVLRSSTSTSSVWNTGPMCHGSGCQ